MLYFAYGSNMSKSTMERLAPSSTWIGHARLPDYRFRFGRRSIRTGTGVADVVPHQGFTTMGAVFDVPEDEWDDLRQKEGLSLASPAYRETEVEVYALADGSPLRATTFVVDKPEREEQVPSIAYMTGIVTQLDGNQLRSYAAFMRWLRSQADAARGQAEFRPGLLVVGTSERGKARGRYIVRANPGLWPDARKTRLVSIEFNGKVVVAAFEADARIAGDVCEIDQNLRHALGMVGQRSYGYTVHLEPQAGRAVLAALVRPRHLCLSLHQPNWTDSEKGVCILHPKSIAVLGIAEGEYVEVECARRTGRGSIGKKVIRLRAYSSEQRTGERRQYPAVDHVYLDSDCRRQLGLPEDIQEFFEWPIIVRPSLRHQLRRRLAVYGVTFFLGIASLSQIFNLLFPALPGPARGLIAIGTAIVATTLVAWADIRANITY